MQAPSTSTISLMVLLPLMAWRVYSRIRRMVGRQRLSRIRPWITLTIFPLLIALYAVGARAHVELLCWLAGGMAAGLLLAQYGLRRTVFEPTAQGLFYTPNAHLGIGLSLLFVGRIVYRLLEIFVLASGQPIDWSDFARSPPTLAIFGLLSGYYMGYAIGLIRWRARVMRANAASEAAAGGHGP